MKVFNIKGLVFCLFVSTALFFSCNTTNSLNNITNESSDKSSSSNLGDDSENESDANQLESNDLDSLKSETEVQIDIPVPVIPTQEEIFLEKLSNLNIEIIECPSKPINSGKTFDKPYTIKVTCKAEESLQTDKAESTTDSVASAAIEQEIKITYPSGKDKSHPAPGNLIFNSKIEKTDSNGIITFVPENTDFSAFDVVSFSPVVPEDLSFSEEQTELLSNLLTEKTVSAQWKVRSRNLYNKGAVLFVWDFSEKNNPVNNSYELLSELRKRVSNNFGNAPVNETTDIGKSLSTLYNLNYEIIGGDAYGYLITGTIKFTQKVALVEGTSDYLCSLVASISAVNMKNGEVVFDTQIYQEATGANWNKAVSSCKTQLSEKIVDALLYGL